MINVRFFHFEDMDLELLLSAAAVVQTNEKEGKIAEFAACNVVQLDYDRLQLQPMLDGHEPLAFVRNNLLKDPSSFRIFIS